VRWEAERESKKKSLLGFSLGLQTPASTPQLLVPPACRDRDLTQAVLSWVVISGLTIHSLAAAKKIRVPRPVCGARTKDEGTPWPHWMRSNWTLSDDQAALGSLAATISQMICSLKATTVADSRSFSPCFTTGRFAEAKHSVIVK
jgi:hypothetical protein